MVKVKHTATYGRGVYAAKRFSEGEVVEVAPVLIVPKKQVRGVLHCYVYDFDKHSGLALGNGSLYNHSDRANLDWTRNVRNRTIRYVANRPIRRGEQLFIDYGYDPRDYHKTRHYLLKKNLRG